MTAAEPAALVELLAVQDHDTTLDGLRHRRETLPQRQELDDIAAQRDALAASMAEVEEARHELGRTQKRLEDEVALLDERIAREDARMYSGDVVAVKELQALQEEIAGLNKRKTLVEDQILDVMEQIEPVDATLATAAAERARLDAQEAELLAALADAEAEVDGQVEEVSAQRAERAAGVPPELLDVYDGLRSQPGRMGVARLVGTTCHGCHLELAAVEVDRLKKLPADELVLCDECGCILVR